MTKKYIALAMMPVAQTIIARTPEEADALARHWAATEMQGAFLHSVVPASLASNSKSPWFCDDKEEWPEMPFDPEPPPEAA